MSKEKRTKIIALVLILAVVIAAIIEISSDLKKNSAEAVPETTVAVEEEPTEAPETPAQVNLVWNDAEQNWVAEADGQALADYTGIASNEWGQFYVSNGKYDNSFSGSFVQNGTTYNIEAGQVKA